MSLEKAIEHNKEYRKQYQDSRKFDKTCRCHGSCTWCQSKRTYNARKVIQNANDDLKQYVNFDKK